MEQPDLVLTARTPPADSDLHSHGAAPEAGTLSIDSAGGGGGGGGISRRSISVVSEEGALPTFAPIPRIGTSNENCPLGSRRSRRPLAAVTDESTSESMSQPQRDDPLSFTVHSARRDDDPPLTAPLLPFFAATQTPSDGPVSSNSRTLSLPAMTVMPPAVRSAPAFDGDSSQSSSPSSPDASPRHFSDPRRKHQPSLMCISSVSLNSSLQEGAHSLEPAADNRASFSIEMLTQPNRMRRTKSAVATATAATTATAQLVVGVRRASPLRVFSLTENAEFRDDAVEANDEETSSASPKAATATGDLMPHPPHVDAPKSTASSTSYRRFDTMKRDQLASRTQGLSGPELPSGTSSDAPIRTELSVDPNADVL